MFILLAAGLFHLFNWWYDKYLFFLIFPGVVFFTMLVSRVPIKTILVFTGIFIFLIGPDNVLLSLSSVPYEALLRMELIAPDAINQKSNLSFPDANSTITELQKLSLQENLYNIMGSTWLGITGFFGASLWLMIFPTQGLAFLPFLTLGLMSSVVGQRFEFYAAPILWFGLAWLFLSFIRFLQHSINFRKTLRPPPIEFNFGHKLQVIVGSFLFIIGVSTFLNNFNTSKGIMLVWPAYSPEVISGFSKLKQIDQRKGGVIATWWDYGYFVHHKTGMPTLHDPGDKGGH